MIIGQELAQYRVLAKLGEGGMGEVYRASDTRLHRVVALKVLAPRFADDPDFSARFDREARLLAALNHPNIAAIYGLEDTNGIKALVLEYVEGRTLADIISSAGHSALSSNEAIAIAKQIADALAAAHEKGIIHRDLKPANVKVTPSGVVKVLDFGLAKATTPSGPSAHTSDASTKLDDATELGVVLGTTAYMSPEQARGRPVDARTDIWAFGCVLFEMLTGAPVFRGDTRSDTIARVLEREPAWDRLPARTSPAVRRLLEHCLAKDQDARLADIRQARHTLEDAGAPAAHRAWRWAGMGIAAVAIIAAVVYGRSVFDPVRSPGPTASIKSVAVLPLTDTSGQTGEDYFSAGMTNELIAALSKIHAWRVISRTSVMQYKGTTKTLPAIAKELGVDALIEGSVQRSADRVRITVRLVRAGPQEDALYTRTFERDLSDALDVQSDMAREITSTIQLTLTPTEAERLTARHPVDPLVLDLYLKGRAAAETGTETDINAAIDNFTQAIKKDPAFAPAYAALALAYNSLNPAYRAPKDVMPKARDYANKALALDNTLSEAHTALASVLFRFDWNWAGAEKEVKLAIDFDPSSADAHELYGNYLCAVGEQSRAIAELRVARDLNPGAMSPELSLMGAYITGRQYDEGIREAKRVLQTNDNVAFAHSWLGMAYLGQKQFAQAVVEATRARDLDKNVTTMHFLAIAEAAAGNRVEAKRLLQDIETAAATRYTCAYEVASAHLYLGQTDKVWQWLKKGEDEQCDCMVWLTAEPWMDPLRVDPRYTALVKRVGPPRK